MINSYFSKHIQEPHAIEKRKLAKRSKFSLIRVDKIFMLSFMTLDMDLVMMSDRKGMLRCIVMLSFISLNMDLIMTPDKKKEVYVLFSKVTSQPILQRKVVLKPEIHKKGCNGLDNTEGFPNGRH